MNMRSHPTGCSRRPTYRAAVVARYVLGLLQLTARRKLSITKRNGQTIGGSSIMADNVLLVSVMNGHVNKSLA